uniref:Tyrosine-protein kinase n=1 Tax=Panagrellus redivivus TaxID=6233 RepID=A0A7E4UZG6_PANRE
MAPPRHRPPEDEEYYHGLLPREDLPYLLQEPGDFLLRYSEVKPGQENNHRQLILSVCTEKGTDLASRGMKHLVVQRLQNGKYCIDNRCSFDSVSELVNEFLRTRDTLFHGKMVYIQTPVTRQPWELVHEDVELTKKLGEGAFGEVHAGRLTLQQTKRKVDVAVKLAKTSEMTKEKIKEMMKEARLMRNYDHPNIVRLYGVAVEREPLMIVMELINGGALDEYLKKNQATCSAAEKLDNMVMGAAFGLEYLHAKNCIHRDIAARNCLYADGTTVKISDFGLSREGDQYALKQARRVPIKWLAPETINTLVYSAKSDVWSYGVLCYEVYAVSEPYLGLTNADVKEKVINGYKMTFPEETPHELVQLITDHCWAMKPEDRYTMTQVVKRLSEMTGIQAPVYASASNMSNLSAQSDKKPKNKRGIGVGVAIRKGDSGVVIGQSTRTKKQPRKKKNF